MLSELRSAYAEPEFQEKCLGLARAHLGGSEASRLEVSDGSNRVFWASDVQLH